MRPTVFIGRESPDDGCGAWPFAAEVMEVAACAAAVTWAAAMLGGFGCRAILAILDLLR